MFNAAWEIGVLRKKDPKQIQNACIVLASIIAIVVIADILGINYEVILGWGIYGLVALGAVIVVAILIHENWKMYKK